MGLKCSTGSPRQWRPSCRSRRYAEQRWHRAFSRCPTDVTPRSFSVSCVKLGRTVSSMSFSRNAVSYLPRPKLRSQTTMSMMAPTISGGVHHLPGKQGCPGWRSGPEGLQSTLRSNRNRSFGCKRGQFGNAPRVDQIGRRAALLNRSSRGAKLISEPQKCLIVPSFFLKTLKIVSPQFSPSGTRCCARIPLENLEVSPN